MPYNIVNFFMVFLQLGPSMQVLSPGVAATCFDFGFKSPNPRVPPCLSLNLSNGPNWVEDLLPDENIYGGSMATVQAGPTGFLWFLSGSKAQQTDRKWRG